MRNDSSDPKNSNIDNVNVDELNKAAHMVKVMERGLHPSSRLRISDVNMQTLSLMGDSFSFILCEVVFTSCHLDLGITEPWIPIFGMPGTLSQIRENWKKRYRWMKSSVEPTLKKGHT